MALFRQSHCLAFVQSVFIVVVSAETPQTNQTAQPGLCRNPLFRAHWHSRQHDAGQLNQRPAPHDHLVLCKMWNHNASCCNPSMEAPQKATFDIQSSIFTQNVAKLRSYFTSLQSLRSSEVYRHTNPAEKVLLDRAIGTFHAAFDLVPACVRALMAFVAGMVCFSCNPYWMDFVEQNVHDVVVSVNIDGMSCIHVDEHCGPFGFAVQQIMQGVLASDLAKRPVSPLPDLSMFVDREKLCHWLRSTIALQPMRAVAFKGELSAGDGSATASQIPPRRLDIVDTDLRDGKLPPERSLAALRQIKALDPVADGELSGFDLDKVAKVVAAGRRLQTGKLGSDDAVLAGDKTVGFWREGVQASAVPLANSSDFRSVSGLIFQ
eukprot:TRINITY_DN44552_c0_g1_i1.p1 TRINITY_DN44552_c0_g1~~TRINITY_DN44552_c0_g1_i1.p1  ORF type:complete len:377 (-),score=52.59 TRINITY_DN44552_c0_g1_i1:6-1136(-)